ncbi:glycosyltransferase family 4 protein [Intrasporangium sp.]|jgi:glycosyltransferase involved in cell wall biosynthesis|uniref:glycosyltransferase family 4 protein n=1 Tax=Intrasporangium sp. TaxID=1925024 RepID=UPI0033655C4D
MNEPLRIAVIATPYTEIPPEGYGGTELFLSNLADGLVERGHDVTVYGVGNSTTKGRFVMLRDEAQYDRMGQLMPEIVHVATLEPALARESFDVIHDNTVAGLLVARSRRAPTIATMHSPMDDEMGIVAEAVSDAVDLVAISEDQRASGLPKRWAATIHHAVRVSDFPFQEDKEDWALFLGRMSPDKGAPEAIEAARAAGVRLRIAAKCVEPDEQSYFAEHVEPLLGPDVEWLGEVGGQDKLELLGRARCLLFPIQWDEPFGLVMIESLACGTPVVAMARGSVPEVLEQGRTGLFAEDESELPGLLRQVGDLSPADCRAAAEERFDIPRMVDEYVRVYREAIERRAAAPA